MSKKVYISLVNWSNWQDTLNVVQQLTGFEYSDLKITIAVVDNASPNDSFEQLHMHLPDTVHLTQATSNEGYAAGHTINLRRAKEENSDYFWVLNSDVELFEQTLIELVKVSEQFNDQALIGSVTLSDQNTIDFGGSEWEPNDTELHYNDWKGRPINDLLEKHSEYFRVQSLEGSSLLVPIPVVEHYGFMKTDFFMYGEEIDYCLRLKKKGVKSVIASRSQLLHRNAGSMSSFKNLEKVSAYYRRRNSLRLNKEYFGWSLIKILGFPEGIISNLKMLISEHKTRHLNYYFALGSLHCALGIKGKKINPDQIIERK